MVEAELGDEQRREDPTVNSLEERGARFLGQEAAVFLPTATMANQIALKISTEPGDEVVAEAGCHIFRSELAGAAFHSGLAMKAIHGDRGLFAPADVRDAMWHGDVHEPPTRLLCLENTHNAGGGKIWPLDLLRERWLARLAGSAWPCISTAHGSPTRRSRAGVPAPEYGQEFDSVTLCLSKGLGCPLGALLAGSEVRMAKARRLKHLFGGAMRQAGVVAAAGIYAFDHNVDRLAEDHANATRLAEGLAAAGLPVDPQEVETNFVLLDAEALGLGVAERSRTSARRRRASLRGRARGTSAGGDASRRVAG